MKQIQSKRIYLVPLTDEELRKRGDDCCDEHMKNAYAQMLDGCLAHPDDRLWYTEWDIRLKEGGTGIGGLSFKGPPVNGEVELGYGIDEEWRGQKFATEAAYALIEWAFGHDGVYFVTAETEPDNAASRRVLEKLAFKPVGLGAEGPRFEKEKAQPNWFSIFMCLGMGAGCAIGAALGGIAAGMSTGIAIGLAVGLLLDAGEKRTREKLRILRGVPKPPKTE